MKDGIAIAGNLIVDYVKEIDVYPSEGMLTNIRKVEMGVGGCAANTSIDLKKIDGSLPVEVLGMVGDDANGRFVTEELEKHGVNIEGVKVNDNIVTSFTDVMTVSGTKVRTFFHARGANAVFDFADIDFNRIRSRFFHIGYALLLDSFDAPDDEYGTVMAKTLACAKQHGLVTSMDVVSENSDRFASVVTPSLKYCDNLIINEVEASMIVGKTVRQGDVLDKAALEDVCGALMEAGVGKRVVIHAPEAACALERDGRFVYVPSLKLPPGYIKGTVGAGDAFCAGVLYSLYKDYSIEDTLLTGAGAAASSLSELNAVDGVGDIEHIRSLIQQYRV